MRRGRVGSKHGPKTTLKPLQAFLLGIAQLPDLNLLPSFPGFQLNRLFAFHLNPRFLELLNPHEITRSFV